MRTRTIKVAFANDFAMPEGAHLRPDLTFPVLKVLSMKLPLDIDIEGCTETELNKIQVACQRGKPLSYRRKPMELEDKDKEMLASLVNRVGPLAVLACMRDQSQARSRQLRLPAQAMDKQEEDEVGVWTAFAVEMLRLVEPMNNKARVLAQMRDLLTQKTEEAKKELDDIIAKLMREYLRMQPNAFTKEDTDGQG